jgi:ribonuclease M5
MKLSNVSRETLPLLFVVEGKRDIEKLSSVIDAPILSTNGAAVTDDFINQLIQLEELYNIVLLLDPDGPGEKIRSNISAKLQYPSHIFIPVEKARSRNNIKVGVEHVSRETLKELIGDLKTINLVNSLSVNQLYHLGLVGSHGAHERRQFVCDKLGIGLANAKTLISKLQLFGFTYQDVVTVLEAYE